MRSYAPEIDVPAVLRAVEREVAHAVPDGAEVAGRVLQGLVPPAWALEWYLPWWLGQAFALRQPLVHDLVRSNVLGLLSVRLSDDIADGDMDRVEIPVAHRVAAAAYEGALAVYRARLATEDRFWSFLERSMGAWRTGSDGPNATSRGAPLKIAAYASCVLAGRPAAWPALDRCLDHVLAAYVRYDQFCDWESDLEAGRWNAFVDTVTQTGPRLRDPAHTRSAVLAAMLTTSVVDRWFQLIDADALRAHTAAREIGVIGLSDHLEDWATRTRGQGSDFDAHYRLAADRATEMMFGGALRAVVPAAPAVSTR